MTEPKTPPNPESGSESPEELSRSLDTLLGRQDWEVDTDGKTPVSPLMDSSLEIPPAVETVSPTEEAVITPPSPIRIIEAMLFIGGPPLSAVRACEAIRGFSEAQFHQAIETLSIRYRKQGRPYAIHAQGQGYILALRPRFRSITEKLYGGVRKARLSTTAIDVLALVAYRQPATKQEVDTIRGAESGSVLRQLVRRGLIAVVQRAESPEREVAYGTTPKFLQFFGLRSLDDLPQTQDLQQI